MIPSFGVPFVPPLILAGLDVLFSLLCLVLFFTAFLDRPHLVIRRRAAVADVVIVLLLAVAAMVLPYEGEHRRRCRPALLGYGFRTDALVRSSSDPCASGGQLLVTFGWVTALLTLLLVGIWWWAGDS